MDHSFLSNSFQTRNHQTSQFIIQIGRFLLNSRCSILHHITFDDDQVLTKKLRKSFLNRQETHNLKDFFCWVFQILMEGRSGKTESGLLMFWLLKTYHWKINENAVNTELHLDEFYAALTSLTFLPS